VDGFVRIQTMGATLSEVSVQWCTLWVLTAVYFGLACLGMRNIIRRVENRQE
jgi:ABC-2 type transport system permease protein